MWSIKEALKTSDSSVAKMVSAIDFRNADLINVPGEFPVSIEGESFEKMEWLFMHVFHLGAKLSISRNELKELAYAIDRFTTILATTSENELSLHEYYTKIMLVSNSDMD